MSAGQPVSALRTRAVLTGMQVIALIKPGTDDKAVVGKRRGDRCRFVPVAGNDVSRWWQRQGMLTILLKARLPARKQCRISYRRAKAHYVRRIEDETGLVL